MNKQYFPRRHFLRSSTSLVALPFLPSIGFNRHLHATSPSNKTKTKRIVFIGVGYGVNKGWYPSRKEVGYNYTLTNSLKPLTKYKKDFTITQNMQHEHGGDGHAGSQYWLTGADRYTVPGSRTYNAISVDQIASDQFGKYTRYTYMALGSKFSEPSEGHGSALSFNSKGKPIKPLSTPLIFFHKLFSGDSVPLAQRIAELNKKRSILDTVRVNARSIKKNMSREDLEKLEEYFDSIREIEIRLAKEEKWMDIPKAQLEEPLKEPPAEIGGKAEFKMMIDLMIAAMTVDASRVFTYMAPVHSFVRDSGTEFSPHRLSHLDGTDVVAASVGRDKALSKMFAYFIQRLKETQDKDGQSLFDNTTVVQGTQLSHVHHLVNCPTLITGNGAGFKHGRHLVMKDGVPLCNLWLSILKGSGVDVKSFSDSTGVIDELYRA